MVLLRLEPRPCVWGGPVRATKYIAECVPSVATVLADGRGNAREENEPNAGSPEGWESVEIRRYSQNIAQI